MTWKNNEERYGSMAMLLHWLSAMLIISLLVIGIYMVDLPDGDDKWGFYDLHKSLGALFFMLLIMRVVWKHLNTTPPLPHNLKPYEHRLAHATHIILYAMMIIMPISGYIDSSAGGYHLSFFGWFEVPMLIDKNESLANISVFIHEYIGYALIAMVLLHFAAALKHHIVLKDNVLRRMLPVNLRK